jgi:hypothetical protein
LSPAQRREVAGAIAEGVLGLGEQIHPVAASVKDGDLVAAPKRVVGDVPAEEDRASEDEQAHDAQPISCAILATNSCRSTLGG